MLWARLAQTLAAQLGECPAAGQMAGNQTRVFLCLLKSFNVKESSTVFVRSKSQGATDGGVHEHSAAV